MSTTRKHFPLLAAYLIKLLRKESVCTEKLTAILATNPAQNWRRCKIAALMKEPERSTKLKEILDKNISLLFLSDAEYAANLLGRKLNSQEAERYVSVSLKKGEVLRAQNAARKYLNRSLTFNEAHKGLEKFEYLDRHNYYNTNRNIFAICRSILTMYQKKVINDQRDEGKNICVPENRPTKINKMGDLVYNDDW